MWCSNETCPMICRLFRQAHNNDWHDGCTPSHNCSSSSICSVPSAAEVIIVKAHLPNPCFNHCTLQLLEGHMQDMSTDTPGSWQTIAKHTLMVENTLLTSSLNQTATFRLESRCPPAFGIPPVQMMLKFAQNLDPAIAAGAQRADASDVPLHSCMQHSLHAVYVLPFIFDMNEAHAGHRQSYSFDVNGSGQQLQLWPALKSTTRNLVGPFSLKWIAQVCLAVVAAALEASCHLHTTTG